VVIVGVIVGCVGCAVNSLVLALLHWKFNTAYDFIDQDKWAEAFFSYLFISLFFITISTLLCVWEPKAVGSGVSEIKSLLNGVKLDSYISLKVVLAKAFGTCFSVASGLPVGKKAPMIFVGAGISALVSSVDQTFLGKSLRAFQLQE
jgi:H+/Cl- antiporter ClcA